METFNMQSIANTVWQAGVKTSDQVSPLMVRGMARRWSALLVVMLGTSFTAAVIFQLVDLYANCTQENNCIVCSLSIGEKEGADCTPLAATDIRIAAGCASYTLPNRMSQIEPVFVGINKTIEEMRSKQLIPVTLYESFRRHGEILTAVRSNSKGQMIDPNPREVLKFLNENYFGLSDVSLKLGATPNRRLTPNVEAAVIAVGLKIIYSYISTGCSVFSAYNTNVSLAEFEDDDDYYYGPNDLAVSDDAFADDYVDDDYGFVGTDTISNEGQLVNVTKFSVCGCELACPRYTEEEGLVFDTIIGALDVSIEDLNVLHGLGSVDLYIPDEYVTAAKPIRESRQLRNASSVKATAELLYAENGRLRHCSANVFTNTPAQLNGVLFECCSEKTHLEKLSEVSAFSSFVLTVMIVVTTVMFWYCQGKAIYVSEDDEEQASAELKETSIEQ